MPLVFGVVVSAITVVLFAWGYAQHRRPVPAGWTRHGFLSSALVILLVSLLPAAVGALVVAFIDPSRTLSSLGPVGAGAIAVSLAVAAFVTPRLMRQVTSVTTAEITPFPVRPGGAPVTPQKRFKRAA